jgi:hypothetical protein
VDILLPGQFWRESEFVRLPDGRWLTGACGPNALAMGWSWAAQHHHSVLDVYDVMRAHDLCDPNGISRMDAIRTAAELLDIATPAYQPFSEPWPDWRPFFLTELQLGHAILYLTSEAWRLKDAIGGEGENAVTDPDDPRCLRRHFLLIVGHADQGPYGAGWWACDGANYAGGNILFNDFRAENVLQFYPEASLAASGPCAALTIGPSIAIQEASQPGAGRVG